MEKFALFNLLKALNSINSPSSGQKNDENVDIAKTQPQQKASQQKSSPQAVQSEPSSDFIANVLARHEVISNRVHSKKR